MEGLYSEAEKDRCGKIGDSLGGNSHQILTIQKKNLAANERERVDQALTSQKKPAAIEAQENGERKARVDEDTGWVVVGSYGEADGWEHV